MLEQKAPSYQTEGNTNFCSYLQTSALMTKGLLPGREDLLDLPMHCYFGLICKDLLEKC